MKKLTFTCDWCKVVIVKSDSALPEGWESTDYFRVFDQDAYDAGEHLCAKCTEGLRRDIRTTIRRAHLLSTHFAELKHFATPGTLQMLRVELECAELAFDRAGLQDEKNELYTARLHVSAAHTVLEGRDIGRRE